MIRIEIQGDGAADELTRGLLEEIADDLRDALGDMRCPEHGEEPDILIQATEEDEVHVKVGACCEQLEEMVDAVLRNVAEDEEELDGA